MKGFENAHTALLGAYGPLKAILDGPPAPKGPDPADVATAAAAKVVDPMATRLTTLEGRMTAVETKVDGVDRKVDAGFGKLSEQLTKLLEELGPPDEPAPHAPGIPPAAAGR